MLRALALRALALCCATMAVSGPSAAADDPPPQLHGLPLLLAEDFEQGADRWEPLDPAGWRIEQVDGNHVYSQFRKQSNYKPPHRSPFNLALLRDVVVGDFVLLAKVRSTIPDYNHRDACLAFGFQDAAHFYYVHLGKRADDHANQIFIVDDAPRTKISTKTTEGTPWDDNWHQVKIVRRVKDGTIAVYFDDMDTPVMTATSDRFTWGRIGIGTFDDTSQWDDVRLYGVRVRGEK